jgi:hypothetical protein
LLLWAEEDGGGGGSDLESGDGGGSDGLRDAASEVGVDGAAVKRRRRSVLTDRQKGEAKRVGRERGEERETYKTERVRSRTTVLLTPPR